MQLMLKNAITQQTSYTEPVNGESKLQLPPPEFSSSGKQCMCMKCIIYFIHVDYVTNVYGSRVNPVVWL